MNSSDNDLLKWEHLVGAENAEGKKLTEVMLRKWSDDPKRKLECVFCGRQYHVDTPTCYACGEYKGLVPFIEGWSDWS